MPNRQTPATPIHSCLRSEIPSRHECPARAPADFRGARQRLREAISRLLSTLPFPGSGHVLDFLLKPDVFGRTAYENREHSRCGVPVPLDGIEIGKRVTPQIDFYARLLPGRESDFSKCLEFLRRPVDARRILGNIDLRHLRAFTLPRVLNIEGNLHRLAGRDCQIAVLEGRVGEAMAEGEKRFEMFRSEERR